MNKKINIGRHMSSSLVLALIASPVLVAGSAEVQQKPAQTDPPDPPDAAPPALPKPQGEWPLRSYFSDPLLSIAVPVRNYSSEPFSFCEPYPRKRSKRGQRSAGRKGWMR